MGVKVYIQRECHLSAVMASKVSRLCRYQSTFPGFPHGGGPRCASNLGWAPGWRGPAERAEWFSAAPGRPQHLQHCQSAVHHRFLHKQAGLCSAVLW